MQNGGKVSNFRFHEIYLTSGPDIHRANAYLKEIDVPVGATVDFHRVAEKGIWCFGVCKPESWLVEEMLNKIGLELVTGYQFGVASIKHGVPPHVLGRMKLFSFLSEIVVGAGMDGVLTEETGGISVLILQGDVFMDPYFHIPEEAGHLPGTITWADLN